MTKSAWGAEQQARRIRAAVSGQRDFLDPFADGPGAITFIGGVFVGGLLSVLAACGMAACGLIRIGGLA